MKHENWENPQEQGDAKSGLEEGKKIADLCSTGTRSVQGSSYLYVFETLTTGESRFAITSTHTKVYTPDLGDLLIGHTRKPDTQARAATRESPGLSGELMQPRAQPARPMPLRTGRYPPRFDPFPRT